MSRRRDEAGMSVRVAQDADTCLMDEGTGRREAKREEEEAEKKGYHRLFLLYRTPPIPPFRASLTHVK